MDKFIQRSLAHQLFLPKNLHCRDAHLFLESNRERYGFEAVTHVEWVNIHAAGHVLHSHKGPVKSHLGAVEIVVLQRHFEYAGVVVAGDADVARHFLLAELIQAF